MSHSATLSTERSDTCPVWVGYLLASRLRWLVHNPKRIIAPYIAPGMTVLDVGSAMGFFSLPAARAAGASGNVVCVDLQPKMLEVLKRRARRRGLLERLELRACTAVDLGLADLEGQVGFALAFAMVHEAADPARLLEQIAKTLRKDGRLLVAEPNGHVSSQAFADTVVAAEQAGLRLLERPKISWSRSALFAPR
ncbi:MAG: methyltransferase type 11 [Proteobacteria bacterium]|nr:MAG: methyltransferase type 11 [Pseudomonadota bacterium]PIE19390.1 MAG: methyltransferase type 11 [Pseudomonadota bacterium]